MDVRRKRNDKKTKLNININKKAIAIIVLTLVIIFSIILFARGILSRNKKVTDNSTNEKINMLFEEINKQGEEFIKPEDKVINITVIGGISCEGDILNSAYNQETEEYNFYNSFHRITNRVLNADIAIGTLNTNFADKPYSSYNKKNAPKELAEALKLIGVDILSTATNYSYDYGVEGIISTKKILEENSINSIGTYGLEEEAGTILIKEVEDVKIAFLAYTDTTNKKIEKNNSYAVNMINKEKIKADIENARENGADFIFVNMNWGDEKSQKLTDEQKDLADFLVENNVDFIIGTHPIFVQPMEMRKNSDGKDALIAYSLGNFLSSENYQKSNVGLILNIEITKSAETGEKYLSKVVYNPVYILDNGPKSASRYEILDIREEIKKYEENSKEKVESEVYEALKDALIEIEKVVGGNS